ncbi:MAG: transcription antitermination factor NusB [Deltaproteobacteria bacterium]|nr:transcription antitermination factor NusB [Deltaproteobacteria bacterium]
MTTRHRGREVALQMLFQYDDSQIPADQIVELYRNSFSEGSLPDEFSIRLFFAVTGKMEELDQVIEQSSEHWRLDRMSRVDRNVLRIGVNEILADNDVPAPVAINEAVELAKHFGADESPSFVNGILDRVARDRQKI